MLRRFQYPGVILNFSGFIPTLVIRGIASLMANGYPWPWDITGCDSNILSAHTWRCIRALPLTLKCSPSVASRSLIVISWAWVVGVSFIVSGCGSIVVIAVGHSTSPKRGVIIVALGSFPVSYLLRQWRCQTGFEVLRWGEPLDLPLPVLC